MLVMIAVLLFLIWLEVGTPDAEKAAAAKERAETWGLVASLIIGAGLALFVLWCIAFVWAAFGTATMSYLVLLLGVVWLASFFKKTMQDNKRMALEFEAGNLIRFRAAVAMIVRNGLLSNPHPSYAEAEAHVLSLPIFRTIKLYRKNTPPKL